MNKKVFIAMLILSVSFLVGMYVLKIFFPQEFMMGIQNEKLIAVGNYIDNHRWLFCICGGLTSFVTYYLYCCACSHRLWLRWYEILIILIVVVLIKVINFYDMNMATIISWTNFVFLPALFKGYIKTTAIVFTVHSVLQGLSLNIRGFTMYLASTNFITMLLLSIDMYLWLILFYILFNYKRKEN